MWLTGFDAPSCSTVYLDKPMRNHTLMQTIARANRVFPGKHSGLIVDYAKCLPRWKKPWPFMAPAVAVPRPCATRPNSSASCGALEEATAFCAAHRVDLAAIEAVPSRTFERVKLIGEAVEKLISPDPMRKEFLAHERLVSTL